MNPSTFTLPASIGDDIIYYDGYGRKWPCSVGQWLWLRTGWVVYLEWGSGKQPFPNPLTLAEFIKKFQSKEDNHA